MVRISSKKAGRLQKMQLNRSLPGSQNAHMVYKPQGRSRGTRKGTFCTNLYTLVVLMSLQSNI